MKQLLLLSGFVLLSIITLAQRTISGKVTDDKGNAVANASVIVKGTTTGTISKADGSYSLTIPANAKALIFSSVDMTVVEVAIGNNTVIDAALKTEDKSLQEIVVVGYGTTAQKTKTQATSVIKAESFRNMPIFSPTQALQGQAAGVNMINSSGLLGAAPNVQIRGSSSPARRNATIVCC